MDHLEQADEQDNFMDQELFRFRAIIGHEGPLKMTDPSWKGGKWNVQIEWETVEITFEPLSVIAADDPITCAAYAKEKYLYNLDGWERYRHLIKKEKQLTRAKNSLNSDKSGMQRNICLFFSYQEITLKLWNLIKLTITANGMMPPRLN